MVFSIFIILFIGIIAFFHYVQGFFSSTISAIITIFAAVLAVSYHETVVNSLLKGKMADYAHSMVLCMIFAVVYITLRVIFDAAVQGNVRTPSTVDKVGAGLMGLVAGIFVTGIFAIAVQMLPFDATISFMGAPRYQVEGTKPIVVPVSGGQSKDSFVYEELTDNKLSPEQFKGLLIPVDDWVLDTVYHLSDGGSLAGDRSLASVHPDYLTELFGERLGIQPGGQRVTLNINGSQNIEVNDLFTVANLPAVDGQIPELRKKPFDAKEVKPAADQRILVVRVKVHSGATSDTDELFRFSTGSVHLVGKGYDPNDHAKLVYKDFYPIGMLENGSAVLLDKPDDFLFAKSDGGFDAVFVVDDMLLTGGKGAIKVSPNVSITVKRFADLDLSGMDVSESLTSDASTNLVRTSLLINDRLKGKLPPPAPTVAAPVAKTSAQSVTPANSGSNSGNAPPNPGGPAQGIPSQGTPAVVAPPQPQPGKEIAADISGYAGNGFRAPGSVSVSTAIAGADAQDAAVAGGTVSLKESKISVAKIDPSATLSQLGAADNSYSELYCPPDRTMVQVAVHPYQLGWDWVGQFGTVKVTDANGVTYAPNGVYQLAKTGDSTGLLLRYNATSQAISVASPDGAPVGDTYFIFLIPHASDIKTFSMGGKTQDLSSPLHVQ